MNEFWHWAEAIPWYAWLAIAAVAGACIIVTLSLRHARANRELLHTERPRAIEAGLPTEDPETIHAGAKFMHNAFWISFWLIVTVPGAAFSAASAVTTEFGADHLALTIAIFSVATLASIAAVGGALALMIYSRTHHESSDQNSA